MDFEKIEIELNNEEHQLINEIDDLRKKMDDIDPKKLNAQLFDSIKNKAIESIALSLGVSDLMDGISPKNGLDLEKEYKNYLEWEKKPANEKSKEYKSINIHPDEFKKFIDKTNNLVYNRDELTGDVYKNAIKNKRIENPDGFICSYTGKFYKHGEKYDYEHVISAHEISQDRVLNYTATLEERREVTNSPDNIVVIGRELNQSLGKTKAEDKEQWGERTSSKDSSKTNTDYHETDGKLIKDAVDKSVKNINNLKESRAVEYSLKTKGKIVVGNVAKGAAKAAVGKLLTITVVEIINEYQIEEERDIKESIKNITKNIMIKAKDVLDTFKNHSINGFVSSLVDALLNSLFKIAKNIFKFIKTAFNSILTSIKTLFNSKMSWEERIDEALKILGIAVLGLIGIALEEVIEKALVAALPFTVPFAGFISSTLSGLIVGIGSVLLLQAYQKYQNNIEFSNLQELENLGLEKRAKVNLAQLGINNVKTTEAVFHTIVIFDNTMPLIASFKNFIEENLISIKNSNLLTSNNIIETKSINNENDDLLNILENM
ncbi:hypothetical protein LVDJXP189_1910004 [Flavobacterium psychrophilum]|uniref:hypothetical protein n=1 Tax=Flavobacterium psychrophilum TaxID=96345 RepID=UPI000B7C13B1|nr:hypothetical protein [Flavobacterium psychrophilum]ELV7525253.1 hypothetical protein [Flavobacterium psychrophilum]MCB6062474.1 hypothetical protein [Flavobacterium psychrophilum]SNB42832.1 hypothetical protein LVDJXP189_1910004 [Flavobacterium psychrophilum]